VVGTGAVVAAGVVEAGLVLSVAAIVVVAAVVTADDPADTVVAALSSPPHAAIARAMPSRRERRCMAVTTAGTVDPFLVSAQLPGISRQMVRSSPPW
jgi:hypothetical protein